MADKNYKPDILNCMANLSNDEVFTSPILANAMLDMLPQDLFKSPDTTFLDPCCKTGVFLREVAKRLLKGQIENYEERLKKLNDERDFIRRTINEGNMGKKEIDIDILLEEESAAFLEEVQRVTNHIMTKQVFGIAITELTSLMSRRTLYCSKDSNASYSIVEGEFGRDTRPNKLPDGRIIDNLCNEGNILYEKLEHTWDSTKDEATCIYCGANKKILNRDNDLEGYAYPFIHWTIDEIKEKFRMGNFHIDVVCGNPPYQIGTNEETKQAKPLYHKFIEQAKKLNPKYLIMIIPSRWFSGGIGLNEFRDTMMNDKHISHIVDYANAKECFPANSIGGGVCYFLRNKAYEGDCLFTNINGNETSTIKRSLNEFPTIVRYNKAVSILRKVQGQTSEYFSDLVSPLMPFGLSSNYRGANAKTEEKNIALYSSEKNITYISESEIKKENAYLNKYKIFISKTSSEHAGEPGKDGKFRVISNSIKVVPPQTACTHSYFVIGENENEEIVTNILSYINTKFVRFLILLTISSINLSKTSFNFVPVQDFTKAWTDKELYEKYGLTQAEIDFIESNIKEMK